MNPEVAIDLFKTTVVFALMVILPFLGSVLIVGLFTSLVQAVTSLQEQTLTFVPKIITLGLMLLAFSPWLMRTMIDFATTTISRLPELAR